MSHLPFGRIIYGYGALLLTLLTGPGLAEAQTQGPDTRAAETTAAQPGEDHGLVTAGKRVMEWFTRPLHPELHGVASGGGLGTGVGYTHEPDGDRGWFTDTEAVITLRRYWSAHAESGYAWPRGRASAFVRTRDMNRLNFFGPTNESLLSGRTTFRLEERVVGGLGSVDLWRGLALTWRVEEIWPVLDRGRHPSYPSVEDLFSEPQAPGVATDQPRYGHYHAALDMAHPAGPQDVRTPGTRARVGLSVFDDQTLDRWSFRRLDVEGQHRFRMPGPNGRLTLHVLVQTTDTGTGHNVPFYMQPTLGGNSRVRSFREELIGSDDTTATLRGFTDLRFRDRNAILGQAEYRWTVWKWIDATVFVDAGKVAPRAVELDIQNLKESYGFSLSYMQDGRARGRLDAGFGGGEGATLFLSLGI